MYNRHKGGKNPLRNRYLPFWYIEMSILGRLRGWRSKIDNRKSKQYSTKERDTEPNNKEKEQNNVRKKGKQWSIEDDPDVEPTERIDEEDIVKERRGVGKRLRGTTLWNKTLDLHQSFKNYRPVRTRKKPLYDHQLHDACPKGNMERIKYLLIKDGGTVNEIYRAMTPLQYAIKNEQMEVVRYLVSNHSARIDAGLRGGAFILACQVGNQRIVKFLHKTRPASPTHDTGFFRVTPLMIAADKGHLNICQYLVSECGVDIDAANSHGYTALHCAAAKGHWDVVQYLAKSNADGMALCHPGDTALHRAVMFHRVGTANLLLEYYPRSIHVRNLKGQTPVDLARQHQPSLVATLEKKAQRVHNQIKKHSEPKKPPTKKLATAAKKAAFVTSMRKAAAPRRALDIDVIVPAKRGTEFVVPLPNCTAIAPSKPVDDEDETAK